MQFVLHGEIPLPLYKWRLEKCLHFIKFKSKKLSTTMDHVNELSAIFAEMRQLENEIQERRRALNFLLRSRRTMDPERREARILAATEHIKALEERLQVLRADLQAPIVNSINHGHRGN
ncbi:hypothetical protein HRI_004448200 [Hibiscus trionum]|uniref:Uncharacterized protein n=1 Tax=Hibiscus trionum TaxID=183268 RepID=A0A9W7J475_HIBTR|nr:hypothetical protein HRI_004448200 [Hibiscus trionum]